MAKKVCLCEKICLCDSKKNKVQKFFWPTNKIFFLLKLFQRISKQGGGKPCAV